MGRVVYSELVLILDPPSREHERADILWMESEAYAYAVNTLKSNSTSFKGNDSFQFKFPDRVRSNWFGSAESVFKGLYRVWLESEPNQDGSRYISQKDIKKNSPQNNGRKTIRKRLYEFENAGVLEIVRNYNGPKGLKIKCEWLDRAEEFREKFLNAIKYKAEMDYLRNAYDKQGKRVSDLSGEQLRKAYNSLNKHPLNEDKSYSKNLSANKKLKN